MTRGHPTTHPRLLHFIRFAGLRLSSDCHLFVFFRAGRCSAESLRKELGVGFMRDASQNYSISSRLLRTECELCGQFLKKPPN